MGTWWQRGKGFTRDEDDFMLSSVQVVADDYLVAVSFKGGTGFGYEQRLVRFQLLSNRRGIDLLKMRRISKAYLEGNHITFPCPLVHH